MEISDIENNSQNSEDSLFAGKVPIKVALQQLRLRLLDLTGRNRLINFKHAPGKSLQFIDSNIDATFRRLTADTSNKVVVGAVPEPLRADWVQRNGRPTRPEVKDHAVQLGFDTSYDLFTKKGKRGGGGSGTGGQALTLFYAEDLGKHCRKLEREAKLAVEETGATMLYLVFGFLEYPDVPGSEKLCLAPLVCVPVSLTKIDAGQYSTFHLNFTGEELADNLSLREKIKRDYGLNLPQYDFESETSSIDEYLDSVAATIENSPSWRVRRMMTLTLLSFTNMLLVRDLDPESWPKVGRISALLAHPLVKQVFEGKSTGSASQYAEEYVVDEHPEADLPLIYDADSSQHSALIDVMSGQSRVIEGPPGTGKSQTITNIIASALHAGKKVLFVAEKLAALEVVKSRLTQAGLASFVLELHSNKSNKKRVLEDIAARLATRIPAHGDLPDLLERQEAKRNELKIYADLMNTKGSSGLDLTLHQLMWRAELNRLRSREAALVVQQLDFTGASHTTPVRLAALCDLLRYLAQQIESIGSYGPSHPLWGFFPSEFKPEDDLPVQRTLLDFAARFDAFAAATHSAVSLLGGSNISMSERGSNQLLAVLDSLAPAEAEDIDFGLLPSLFPEGDALGHQSLTVLQDLRFRQHQLNELEAQLHRCLETIQPTVLEETEWVVKALKELEALGIAAYNQAGLSQVQKTLSSATAKAQDALMNLTEAGDVFGIPFDGDQRELSKLSILVEQISKVPPSLFDLRHEGLKKRGAAGALRVAQEKLAMNQARQSDLEKSFYMDALLSEQELKDAILTLREGSTWYRPFQASWRKAMNVHRKFERVKSRKSGSLRLEDLEGLLRHEQAKAAWGSEPAVKEACGSHFQGDLTPLNELAQCGEWIAQSRSAFETVGVHPDVFDPLTVGRARLVRLAAEVLVVNSARTALEELNSVVQSSLPSAASTFNANISTSNWKKKVELLVVSTMQVKHASNIMAGRVRASISAVDGLSAMLQRANVEEQAAQLATHAGGTALFSSCFQGRLTSLEPAFAAHTYGCLIKKAGLPDAVEQVLISKDCVANHERLAAYTDATRHGWRTTLEFVDAMSRYGRFDAALWMEPSNKPTVEYAEALAKKTRQAADSMGRLLPWAQYVAARKEASDQGLESFIVLLEIGAVAPEALEHSFVYRFYSSVIQSAFEKSVVLRRFGGVRHSNVRKDYAELDREIIKLRGRQVAHECRRRANPPTGHHSVRVDEKTEMKLLEHLIPQQRPRVPVRQMLVRAGHAIQELKPCFMMGPQAVAQFLIPGHLHFDIVVMDEASQLRPEQAIGAIARGTQLVVVGDPKQLPPTSFFARTAQLDSDDEGLGQMATSEAESILDVCISHFQPVRTLRWHYRSRHESLIAFSNQHFYRGNLVVFPSPYPKSKALGLRYQYVANGVYEHQMNQVEAARVVEAAVEHILLRPNDSLGLVTLNIKQRDLVAELLEERLRKLPEAIAFREHWDGQGMGLFIKNLENVQGDERDCIFISTTFGKPKGANVVRQNFGPISREGGWRRLNVLFTRARKSVAVFSSMRPEDIVVDSRTPEGTKALRNYLEFAQTGVLRVDQETGLPPDSDFEVSVMDVLRSRGYEVTPQLGVAGFRIDIAVKHPKHPSGYLAAIECDGASYHSGASVRDRDRIRQEILESLGWKGRIWRIWSTDWFRNALAETDRLVQFLEALKAQPLHDDFVLEEPKSADEVMALDDYPTALTPDVDNLVFEDAEGDLEVDVGDLVSYVSVDAPNNIIAVRLTARQSNLELGFVAVNTPLGEALIGSTIGEIVVLRVPGKTSQQFEIRSIRRDSSSSGSESSLLQPSVTT
jgi:very-short-patch-repair endonuclease